MGNIVIIDRNSPGGFKEYYNESMLRADGGGTVLCIGYRDEGKAAGILICEIFNMSILIKWLFVSEEYRRQGVGKRLLSVLYNLGQKAKVKWIDALTVPHEMEKENMEKFGEFCDYERVGLFPTFDIPLSTILNGPLCSKYQHDSAVASLEEVSQMDLHRFTKKLGEKEDAACIRERLTGVDPACSTFYIKNGEILGCLLLADKTEYLEVRWIFAEGTSMIMSLLKETCHRVSEKYDGNTLLHAAAMTEGVENMIRRLGGDSLVEREPVIQYRKYL